MPGGLSETARKPVSAGAEGAMLRGHIKSDSEGCLAFTVSDMGSHLECHDMTQTLKGFLRLWC